MAFLGFVFSKEKNQPTFPVPHPTRGVRYCDQTERSGQQFLCLKQGRRLQNDDSGTNTGILFVCFFCVCVCGEIVGVVFFTEVKHFVNTIS